MNKRVFGGFHSFVSDMCGVTIVTFGHTTASQCLSGHNASTTSDYCSSRPQGDHINKITPRRNVALKVIIILKCFESNELKYRTVFQESVTFSTQIIFTFEMKH